MKNLVRALVPVVVSITATLLLCLGYAMMVDTTQSKSELEPSAGVLSQSDTSAPKQS